MDLGLYVVGEAAKRGVVARLPSSQRLIGDAGTWLAAEVNDLTRSVRLDRNGEAASLFVDLHPAAFPMRLHASNDGAVDALGVTSAVGPGYHTYLHRLIQRIGAALDVIWTTPEGGAGTTETTRFVAGADRTAVEREMLLWLKDALKGVRDARAGGEDGIQLSLPARTRFAFDGALATPLGPRDDALARDRPRAAEGGHRRLALVVRRG